MSVALIAVSVVLAGLALTASAASAAEIHPFQESFNGATSTAGALGAVNRLAINQSTGHVYAIDAGKGVIDQFEATGAPANFSAVGKSSLNLAATCDPGFFFGGEPDISVDNSGGANGGDIYVNGQESRICAYDSAGNFLWSMPPAGNNCGIATDSQGHIWIGSYNAALIEEYGNNGSAGHPPALIGSFPDTTGNACHLAFDSSGFPERAFVNQYMGQVDKYISGTYNATYNPGPTYSVAVDPASHHLYTVTNTSFSEYDATGPPAGALSESGPPELQSGVGIVVNGTGAGGVPKGTVYVSDNATNQVDRFGPLGSYPEATVGEATGVERGSATLHGHVNPAGAGNVTSCHFEYVTEHAFQETAFSTLSSGGTAACEPATPLSSEADVSATPSTLRGGTSYVYRLALANAAGSLATQTSSFTTPPAVETLQTEGATNLTSNGATLNGSYLGDSNDTHFYFEWGVDSNYGHLTPEEDAGSPAGAKSVSAVISGLVTDVTYHYRVVASNKFGTSFGEDKTITLEQPTIDVISASNVSATAADLVAQVNPRGAPTKYRFEYGPGVDYGSSQPIPDGEIPAATSDQLVSVHLENLTPRVTYHFRIVAESIFGTVASEDQTFNFFPPNCPNAHIRQETSSNNLPDCRAYELASAAYSGSAFLFPSTGPGASEASDPGKLAYGAVFGAIPGAGNADNAIGDLYVATRTSEGWVTKFIGLGGNEAQQMGGPPGTGTPALLGSEPDKVQIGVLTDPSLSTVVDWDQGAARSGNGTEPVLGPGASNAPYVWETATNTLIDRWPTNLATVPGGAKFIGGRPDASADLSHFVFSSDIPFVPGALSEAVYDDTVATNEVQVVSKTTANVEFKGTPVKVSSDGSHILLAAPASSNQSPFSIPAGPVELFMRVNDLATYELAPGHKVTYVSMTKVGSKVYFTSPEQLTSEDQDTSTDLYMWSERTNSLTLVSLGSEGTGNSDGCSASWTTKCGIVPINFSAYAAIQGGLGGDGVSDSFMASDNGDIYFYSPEHLDGSTNGVTGAENLYDYREGDLQFVAAFSTEPVCTPDQLSVFCSSGPISRMDVSPDDSHVAFITTSQVTNYSSGGHSEMYSYTPSTRRLTCDSCPPNGEPATQDAYASQKGLFMTNDGRAFFSTQTALVPQDTDNVSDVYEFVEGRPQLISAGTGTGNAEIGGVFIGFQAFSYPGLIEVSADGTDAFFATYDNLVGQDRNGHNLKIYDARSGGGFPFTTPPPSCVAADECHGPGSVAPAALVKGSSPTLRTGAAGPTSHKKPKRGHRKKHHRKTHSQHHKHRGARR